MKSPMDDEDFRFLIGLGACCFLVMAGFGFMVLLFAIADKIA